MEMELVRGDVCYITFGCRGVGVGVGGGYEWKEGRFLFVLFREGFEFVKMLIVYNSLFV